ncbi:hypothetical protein GCM10027034_11010 [Ramlibacter solisilvae]
MTPPLKTVRLDTMVCRLSAKKGVRESPQQAMLDESTGGGPDGGAGAGAGGAGAGAGAGAGGAPVTSLVADPPPPPPQAPTSTEPA